MYATIKQSPTSGLWQLTVFHAERFDRPTTCSSSWHFTRAEAVEEFSWHF